ncbi:hypothetical protein D3C78_1598790 [compost metagenome]
MRLLSLDQQLACLGGSRFQWRATAIGSRGYRVLPLFGPSSGRHDGSPEKQSLYLHLGAGPAESGMVWVPHAGSKNRRDGDDAQSINPDW